jgi:dTMP kinase
MKKLSNTCGLFIAIEGIDGSGKTVQLKLLQRYLKQMGLRYRRFKEPTLGRIGKLLRKALNSTWTEHDEHMLALLFAADRHALYHVRRPCIKESLRQGYVCIVDRSVLTTLVYQGAQLSEQWLLAINHDIPKPDVTIALDVSLKCALKRLAGRRRSKQQEDYEQTNAAKNYHRRYQTLFNRYRTMFHIHLVDGDATPEVVHKKIVWLLHDALQTHDAN